MILPSEVFLIFCIWMFGLFVSTETGKRLRTDLQQNEVFTFNEACVTYIRPKGYVLITTDKRWASVNLSPIEFVPAKRGTSLTKRGRFRILFSMKIT
jgi:hypothetical protein